MKSYTSNRFLFLMPGLILATLALISGMANAQSGERLQVKTKLGKLEGKQDGAVRAYLGIPYAAPPVGSLRWREPMPATKWKGVRQAKEFGARCMQPAIYADMIFRDPGISEDCLTLNIWTPAKKKSEKLPVMVWIYGGGYIAGSTSEARQDGADLAGKGVIVVTLNYRLGIFGFFALPALSAESGRNASGNYGLLDQVAALRWVKENIAAFGGDPGNVTLFGESAGSYSVSVQMASPLAKGLFQKAIGESGASFSNTGIAFPKRASAEQQYADFSRATLGTDRLDQLRAIPAQELLNGSQKKNEQGVATAFRPDIDGYLLPESVPAIFSAGRQNDVPLLAGWNHDEDGILSKTTVASFKKDVQEKYAENAAKLLELYPASDGNQAIRSASDLASDKKIAYATWKWLEAQVTTGKQPVYRYRFDRIVPADPHHPEGNAAYHSGEIPYVFGTLDLLPSYGWTPTDRTLSQQIQQYWTNFARTGDPDGGGLPQWPTYNSASDWQVMHLGPNLMVAPDETRARDLFLDAIWGK